MSRPPLRQRWLGFLDTRYGDVIKVRGGSHGKNRAIALFQKQASSTPGSPCRPTASSLTSAAEAAASPNLRRSPSNTGRNPEGGTFSLLFHKGVVCESIASAAY